MLALKITYLERKQAIILLHSQALPRCSKISDIAESSKHKMLNQSTLAKKLIVKRIDFASNEITEATLDINKGTADIQLFETDFANKAILAQQKEQLRENRAEDHSAFEERQVATPKVVKVLEIIAANLSAIQPEADAEAVLAELERVGGNNPILTLVQLASTFSTENNITSKTRSRNCLEQSIFGDQQEEVQAELNFESKSLKPKNKELPSYQKNLIFQRHQIKTIKIDIIRCVELILASKLEGTTSFIKEESTEVNDIIKPIFNQLQIFFLFLSRVQKILVFIL